MYIPITTLERALESIPNKEYVYEGTVFPTFRFPLIEFTTTLTEGDKESISHKSYYLEFIFDFDINEWTINIK